MTWGETRTEAQELEQQRVATVARACFWGCAALAALALALAFAPGGW